MGWPAPERGVRSHEQDDAQPDRVHPPLARREQAAVTAKTRTVNPKITTGIHHGAPKSGSRQISTTRRTS